MLLNISPFLTRELRVALRHPPKVSRFVAACIVAAISFLALVVCVDFSPRKTGTLLFYGLLTLGLAGVTAARERGSDLFAGERQNGALGLLFSTGITPFEVLVGKFAAALVMPISWLITLTPGLVLAWLMDAASARACHLTLLMLLGLLMLGFSVNLFASLVFEEPSSAKTFADGLLIALVAVLPAVNWLNLLLTGTQLSEALLAISPAYAPWKLFEDPLRPDLGMLFLSCGYSFAFAAVFLAASAWQASRAWKDQAAVNGEFRRNGRRWSESLRRIKQKSTRPLLEQKPYCWLILRDFSPALTCWLALAALVLLWLAGWWKWSNRWLNPINFWASFLILSGVVRWMISHIAARQIGRDRAAGTLEILLTSPLSVEEIISGQKKAMRDFARPFFWLMGIILAIFFVAGFLVHPMNGQARLNYVAFWSGVAIFGPWFDLKSHWMTFWISLNTGRPGLALRRQLVQKGAMASLYIQVFIHRDKLAGIPTGGFGENVFVAILVGGSLLVLFIHKIGWVKNHPSMETKAVEWMRAIAAQPIVEANDPRLKRWEQDKPLHLMKPPLC